MEMGLNFDVFPYTPELFPELENKAIYTSAYFSLFFGRRKFKKKKAKDNYRFAQ